MSKRRAVRGPAEQQSLDHTAKHDGGFKRRKNVVALRASGFCRPDRDRAKVHRDRRLTGESLGRNYFKLAVIPLARSAVCSNERQKSKTPHF